MNDKLKERNDLVANLKETRNKIDDQIDILQERWQDATIEGRAAINKDLNQLKAWGAEVDQKMKDVGEAVSNNWNDFANATRKKMKEIDQKMESLFEEDNS